MSRCLVTGAAGLIGTHLVNHLLSLDHDVVAVDDLSNGCWDPSWSGNKRVTMNEFDITHPYAVSALVAMKPFSVVYHLACAPYEGMSQFCPRFVSDSVVGGTINVLRGCINAGTVRRFVNCSSMARYGKGETLDIRILETGQPVPAMSTTDGSPFSEDRHFPAPEDIYGHGKVMAERCVETLCDLHGIKWCHAVPHNVTGEANIKALSDPYRGAMLIWSNQLLRGVPITIFGDGEQKRAPSYVGDVVPYLAAMGTGGFHDKCHGETINLGGQRAYTINEMSLAVRRAFVSVTGRQDPGVRYEEERPCEVKEAYCSVAKSIRLLGYIDKTSLDEMAERIMQWAYAVAPNGVEPRYLDGFEIEAKAPRVWLERKM